MAPALEVEALEYARLNGLLMPGVIAADPGVEEVGDGILDPFDDLRPRASAFGA